METVNVELVKRFYSKLTYMSTLRHKNTCQRNTSQVSLLTWAKSQRTDFFPNFPFFPCMFDCNLMYNLIETIVVMTGLCLTAVLYLFMQEKFDDESNNGP